MAGIYKKTKYNISVLFKRIFKKLIRGAFMSVVVNKRLYNAKEAANYLSISRALLYQLASKGTIPSVNINTRRLFDVEDCLMLMI